MERKVIVMPSIFSIAAAVFTAIVFIFALVWFIRAQTFRPTKDKARQLGRLNTRLQPTGFAYEPGGDYFYSLMDCWQRDVGYCRLYDEAAPFFNMIMDCESIPFAYGGKRWLIELWKGQYGITSGCEIGVYNTSRADIDTDQFTGTYYEKISDEEMLHLSFELKKDFDVLIKRDRQRHWWLTGFALGSFSEPEALTMDARIGFPNYAMRDSFVRSLAAAGYGEDEYRVRFRTVTVLFRAPHTPQPHTQTGPQRLIAQGLNQKNCALYRTVTAPYTDTLDRLEFLQNMASPLFDFLLNSLYAKGVLEAFEWLLPSLSALPADAPDGPAVPSSKPDLDNPCACDSCAFQPYEYGPYDSCGCGPCDSCALRKPDGPRGPSGTVRDPWDDF